MPHARPYQQSVQKVHELRINDRNKTVADCLPDRRGCDHPPGIFEKDKPNASIVIETANREFETMMQTREKVQDG